MTWSRALVACTAVLLLAAGSAAAQTHVAGSAGVTTAYGETYFSLGAHVGQRLAYGVEPNVEATWWVGPSPMVLKLAPGVDWYPPLQLQRVQPFVGGYYARWIVGSGFDDQNALGARVGVVLGTSGRTSFALSGAYEHVLDCSHNCDSWTPQASVGVMF